MGCAALSPSFHGNLLLWKQALEQTRESGGGDFVAREAEGGEDRGEKSKKNKNKRGEGRENIKKDRKKSGGVSTLVQAHTTSTIQALTQLACHHNFSAEFTLNYIFWPGLAGLLLY